MRPITGSTGSTTRSRLLVSAAASVPTFRRPQGLDHPLGAGRLGAPARRHPAVHLPRRERHARVHRAPGHSRRRRAASQPLAAPRGHRPARCPGRTARPCRARPPAPAAARGPAQTPQPVEPQSVAAASLEPPPSPAATGMRLLQPDPRPGLDRRRPSGAGGPRASPGCRRRWAGRGHRCAATGSRPRPASGDRKGPPPASPWRSRDSRRPACPAPPGPGSPWPRCGARAAGYPVTASTRQRRLPCAAAECQRKS